MPPKQSNPKLNTPDRIRELAKKKGVTIVLDMDDSSQEAKMDSAYSYSSHSKTLTIVASSLEAQDKPLLLEIIKKVFTGGGLIWKDSKEETLDSYNEYSAQNTDGKILGFFQGIMPPDDFIALKLSLYLRSEQLKGKNIHSYKQDIRDRFGDRGSNIANLCSAGYFENEFMPLYNLVSKEEFAEYYEIAIGKKARALFVHFGMDAEEIQSAFEQMVEKAEKYHMHDFRIHGLGEKNVENIKKFFATRTPKDDENFIIQKEYEKVTEPPAIEYAVIFIKPAAQPASE